MLLTKLWYQTVATLLHNIYNISLVFYKQIAVKMRPGNHYQ